MTMKLKSLSLAVLGACAFAPAAFAQDDAGASGGKHFSVVGGYALMQPDSDPIEGSRTDFDGGTMPTLSLAWNANDHWGVELWGAVDKADYRVRGDAGKIGSVGHQPVAISGQYHFGRVDAPFRPFVGLGYFQAKTSDAGIAVEPLQQVPEFDKQKGGIVTLGVDMNISPRWFARVDARYMKANAEIRNFVEHGETNPHDKLEANFDPWTIGAGIGVRF